MALRRPVVGAEGVLALQALLVITMDAVLVQLAACLALVLH